MMIAQRQQTIDLEQRPVSPGIPGDYFECDEMMLVQKLNTLRNVNPFTVPSLLELPTADEGTLQSCLDDPDQFFDEYDNHALAHHEVYRNTDAMERIDDEQISVQSQLSAGTAVLSLSNKSWEGSEIVLQASSFLSAEDEKKLRPPMEDRTDSSPRSIITKLDRFLEDAVPVKRPRGGAATTSTPATASISLSVASKNSLSVSSKKSASKSTAAHVQAKLMNRGVNPIHEIDHESSSSDVDVDDEHDVGMEFNFPSLPIHQEFSAHRSPSFSSSIGGEESFEIELGDDEYVDPFASRKRIPPPRAAASAASPTPRDFSPMLQTQEMFIKLSEDEDLRDFKLINNFSFEGDYLLSRILRERTRIQMKKEMFRSEREMYVETHRPGTRSSARSENRGIFYAI